MSFNPSFEQAIISMETEAPRDFYNLDWTSISGFRFLSEYFIERFYFRLNWSVICNNQRLPEYLIRKFVNFVNFKVISNTQVNNLSLDFIYEFAIFPQWRRDCTVDVTVPRGSVRGVEPESPDSQSWVR